MTDLLKFRLKKFTSLLYFLIPSLLILLGILIRIKGPDHMGIWFFRDIERTFSFWKGNVIDFLGPEMNGAGRLPGPALYLALSPFLLISYSAEAISIFLKVLNLSSILILFQLCRKKIDPLMALLFLALMVCNRLMVLGSYPLNPSFVFILSSVIIFFLFRFFYESSPYSWVLALISIEIGLQFHMSVAMYGLPLVFFLALRRDLWAGKQFLAALGLSLFIHIPWAVHYFYYSFPNHSVLKFHLNQIEITNSINFFYLLGTLCLGGMLVLVFFREKIRRTPKPVLLSGLLGLGVIIPFLLTRALTDYGFTSVVQKLGIRGGKSLHFLFSQDILSLIDQDFSRFHILIHALLGILSTCYFLVKALKKQLSPMDNFVLILFGTLFLGGLFFGNWDHSHLWYKFFVTLPLYFFLSYGSFQVVRPFLISKDRPYYRWIFLALLCFYALYSFHYLSVRFKTLANTPWKEKETPQLFFHSNLKLAEWQLTQLHQELHLSPEDFSRRTFFPTKSYHIIADIYYDYLVNGKFHHFSSHVPATPFLYAEKSPCFYVHLKNLGKGWEEMNQGYLNRLQTISQMISREETASFVKISYRPLFNDFCFTNNRIEWIYDQRLTLMRRHLKTGTKIQKLPSLFPGDPSQNFLFFIDEYQLPLLLSLQVNKKEKKKGQGTYQVRAILDSDYLRGRGTLSWANFHARNFRNARILLGKGDHRKSLAFVEEGKAVEMIFSSDHSYWLAYFPFELLRTLTWEEDPGPQATFVAEFLQADGKTASFSFDFDFEWDSP